MAVSRVCVLCLGVLPRVLWWWWLRFGRAAFIHGWLVGRLV